MRLISEPLNNLLNRRKLIEPEHGSSIWHHDGLDDLHTPSIRPRLHGNQLPQVMPLGTHPFSDPEGVSLTRGLVLRRCYGPRRLDVTYRLRVG